MKEEISKTSELEQKIIELENVLKHEKQNSDHWYSKYNQLNEKFNKYKNAIQSVVEFLD